MKASDEQNADGTMTVTHAMKMSELRRSLVVLSMKTTGITKTAHVENGNLKNRHPTTPSITRRSVASFALS
jgi:hypothetical protein